VPGSKDTPDPQIVAITPPSDIVLDVARAADPDKYRAAVERLRRLNAAAQAPAPAMSAFNVPLPSANSRPEAGAATRVRRDLDAYGRFEAFVLQSFMQAMLPQNASNVYGKGIAGEFWRSMLAEKMGEELARSGQVGIARQLAAGHRNVQPAADPAQATAPATHERS
jgi:hypothetical protein